jgi:5-deoxy-D-glucuronate isomerase
MSGLLRRPTATDPGGAIHRTTPESAGWSYVSVELLQQNPGQTVAAKLPYQVTRSSRLKGEYQPSQRQPEQRVRRSEGTWGPDASSLFF